MNLDNLQYTHIALHFAFFAAKIQLRRLGSTLRQECQSADGPLRERADERDGDFARTEPQELPSFSSPLPFRFLLLEFPMSRETFRPPSLCLKIFRIRFSKHDNREE